MPLFILAIAIPDLFYFMTFNKKKCIFITLLYIYKENFFFFLSLAKIMRGMLKKIFEMKLYMKRIYEV